MTKARLAHNRCNACGIEWWDRPGSFAEHKECPRCGSLYWTWINYDGEFAR